MAGEGEERRGWWRRSARECLHTMSTYSFNPKSLQRWAAGGGQLLHPRAGGDVLAAPFAAFDTPQRRRVRRLTPPNKGPLETIGGTLSDPQGVLLFGYWSTFFCLFHANSLLCFFRVGCHFICIFLSVRGWTSILAWTKQGHWAFILQGFTSLGKLSTLEKKLQPRKLSGDGWEVFRGPWPSDAVTPRSCQGPLSARNFQLATSGGRGEIQGLGGAS